MDAENINTIKRATRNWYFPLILGILFIALGIWVFLTPEASYITLSLLFAYTFFITGILEIIYAVSNRKNHEGWGWSVAGGIIDVLLGVLLISRLDFSMIILSFFVGFGVLFRSILAMGWSIELRKQKVQGWGALLATSILGLLFSFILIWNPVFAGLTIVYYTALAFIFIGISSTYLAFRLRDLHKVKS